MAKFKKARPEVEELARRLIGEHHSHLIEARFAYLEREGEWTSKGDVKLGEARKVTPQMKALVDADFVITINGDAWTKLTPEQREALIDHELSHCSRGEDDKHGNPRWEIDKHDVEEFSAVIRRHGLWKPELVQFGKQVAVQERIFEDEKDEQFKKVQ